MHCLLLLLSILAASCLVSATPIDPARWLVNRPVEQQYQRTRRAAQHTKGGEAPSIARIPLTRTQPTLRKGEYLCGNKICKLQPGEVPNNCNGICQYNVAYRHRQ